MSYQFYKMVHIISIVLFFALYALAAFKAGSKLPYKFEKKFTGMLLIVILIGGFGLKKFAAPGEWPLWLILKMVIWFIVGIGGHSILKRFPQNAMKFFWVSVGLLTIASYLANYKL